MKNSTDDGFDQHYNVQAAVDQASFLIVASALSNHPNDKREAEPTLAAISSQELVKESRQVERGGAAVSAGSKIRS